MKKIKRFLRLLLLAFMIGIAAILPVPILFNSKDNLSKNLIEHVETSDDKDEYDEIKELF